jgi:hypothetical protein
VSSCVFLAFRSVHDTADVSQASSAFGVLFGALTAASFFGVKNLLHNLGVTSMVSQVLADIGLRMFETIADELSHSLISREFEVSYRFAGNTTW